MIYREITTVQTVRDQEVRERDNEADGDPLEGCVAVAYHGLKSLRWVHIKMLYFATCFSYCK